MYSRMNFLLMDQQLQLDCNTENYLPKKAYYEKSIFNFYNYDSC